METPPTSQLYQSTPPPAPQPESWRMLWLTIAGAVVLAVAIYSWMKLSPSSPETQQSPTPSATTDPTAGWRIYRNSAFDFTFMYPPSWKLENQSANTLTGLSILLTPPNAEPFTDYFSVGIDTRDLAVIRSVMTTGAGNTETTIVVGGETAYRYFRNTPGPAYIVIPHLGKNYYLTALVDFDDVEHILATFRFLGADAMAEWKTYTSVREPGLSFRYPPSWTLERVDGEGPNGERAVLKAPKVGQYQTTVQWSAWVDGLGGGCPPERPHMVVHEVNPLPRANGFYFVRAGEAGSDEQRDGMGVMDSVDYGVPKLGDTGTCLYYMLFHSKADASCPMWLMATTIQPQDRDVAKQILTSLSY